MASEEAKDPPPTNSRRNFLKQAGATVAAVAFVGIGVPGVLKDPHFPSMAESSGAIARRPDPVHRLPDLRGRLLRGAREGRHVEPAAHPHLQRRQRQGERGGREAVRQARHVPAAGLPAVPGRPCLPVCPVDALHVDDKTHARVINNDTCIACGKCETSCIFPSLDEALATGRQVLHQKARISYDDLLEVYTKCDLCYFRDEGPACVENAPSTSRSRTRRSSPASCAWTSPSRSTPQTFDKMRKMQTASPDRKEMRA